MRDITKRQQEVLEFIAEFIADFGKAPTVKEIQLGCKYKHDTPVMKALYALTKKRYITRTAGRHRSIKIIRLYSRIHTNLQVA